MKKYVLNGALILAISGFICKILGGFYRIPLSNILGVEGIGLYQMIFSLYSLALVIAGGAVPTSMAIVVAKMRAERKGSIKKVFLKYFFISAGLGAIFFAIFLLFAPQISNFQGNALATTGYRYMSFAVLFSALLAPFRGLFQGYENMTPTAVSQILEQSIKLVLGLGLSYAFINMGLEMGVAGALLGIAISELISFIYLLIRAKIFSKSVSDYNDKTPKISKDYILIFLYVLIIPLVTAIDSFLTVNLLNINFSTQISTELFGIQSGMVNSLINFPVIFSLALSTSLLPSLTYYKTKNRVGEVKSKISESLNLVWLVILPCLLGFYILAPTIMSLAYRGLTPEMLNTCVSLLRVSSVQMIFIALLQITASILQASGKLKFLIFNLVISAIIKIALTAILVSNFAFNIYGLSISNIIFYLLSSSANLIYLLKLYKLKINFKKLILPLVFIAIMFFPCLIVQSLNINIIFKLLILALIGTVIYIIPVIYFKLFDIKKLKNLKRQVKK